MLHIFIIHVIQQSWMNGLWWEWGISHFRFSHTILHEWVGYGESRLFLIFIIHTPFCMNELVMVRVGCFSFSVFTHMLYSWVDGLYIARGGPVCHFYYSHVILCSWMSTKITKYQENGLPGVIVQRWYLEGGRQRVVFQVSHLRVLYRGLSFEAHFLFWPSQPDPDLA